MTDWMALALTSAFFTSGAPAFDQAPRACLDLMPNPSGAAVAPARPMMAEDLVRLRDIGEPEDYGAGEQPLSVSPDGRHLAFQLRRANPETNSYCLGLVVIDLATATSPKLVDTGGTFIARDQSVRGNAIGSGVVRVVRPLWAPNGHSLAYLRRDRESIQIWQAWPDGRPARPLTNLDRDIVGFRWDSDGQHLVFSTASAKQVASQKIKEEARSGFLYDDRFVPAIAARPLPRDLGKNDCWRMSIANGQTVPLSSDECRNLPSDADTGKVSAQSLRGDSATYARPVFTGDATAEGITFKYTDGRERLCRQEACLNVLGLSWSPDGRELRIIGRQGWGLGEMVLHTWRGRGDRVRTLHVTDGVISGCENAGQDLVCLMQQATRPKYLVRFDTRTGAFSPLFDPNPEFSRLRFGAVRRLRGFSPMGEKVYADLVLPARHHRGDKHPLVITQYRSKGFLRGNIGDEYPIHAFGDRGIAVLSFQEPSQLARAIIRQSADRIDASTNLRRQWRSRKGPLEALETMIDKAIASGTIDIDRIGITGLSDGGSTLQFALLNSRYRYAAAATSSCCEDPITYPLAGGPAFDAYLRNTRFPAWDIAGDPWDAYSLSRNAKRVRTPILMQLADTEYGYALDAVRALKDAASPVELRVFPDEHHIKWQPAHRLAIYRRNLDWFSFWLNSGQLSAGLDGNEHARWTKFRQQLDLSPSRN